MRAIIRKPIPVKSADTRQCCDPEHSISRLDHSEDRFLAKFLTKRPRPDGIPILRMNNYGESHNYDYEQSVDQSDQDLHLDIVLLVQVTRLFNLPALISFKNSQPNDQIHGFPSQIQAKNVNW